MTADEVIDFLVEQNTEFEVAGPFKLIRSVGRQLCPIHEACWLKAVDRRIVSTRAAADQLQLTLEERCRLRVR